MSLLSVTHLAKSFGGLKAVDDVSFEVAPGELLALIGPNGAGKSTTFNMVNGQLRADSGSVRLDGAVKMNGLLYAQNDVTLHGTGNGSIQGAVVSTNRRDSAFTTIGSPDDSEDIGNAPISYNCPNVRSGGGNLSQNWFVKPGSYREISGS